MNGLVVQNSVCGPQKCEGTVRGRKSYINNFTFGNNYVHEVWSMNNEVKNSYYTPLCEGGIDENGNEYGHRSYWHANAETEDPIVTGVDDEENGLIPLALEDYVAMEPIELSFDWTGCMEVPDISCRDFPLQEINDSIVQTNQNTGEPIYVYSEGVCRQKEGNDCHPNEEDCVDGYVITSDE